MSIQHASKRQNEAAYPHHSVFVSANAGSGKTRVLTNRVIRLLLNGTEPAKILCLTYTKAAAAVMQTRIFDTLSHWTELDDAALAKEIATIEDKTPNADRLLQARRLFANALETPGGLKIQTIHAFCESLLHQFPLEANIPSHFELMDDLHSQDLMENTRRSILKQAYNSENSALYHAYMLILKTVGEHGVNLLLSEAIHNRHGLKDFLDSFYQKSDNSYLYTLLNIQKNETLNDIIEKIYHIAVLEDAYIQSSKNFAHKSMQSFFEKITNLKDSLIYQNLQTDFDNASETIISIAKNAYFTNTGPRKIKSLFAKDFLAHYPSFEEEMQNRQNALEILFDKYIGFKLYALNHAAFLICHALLNHYETHKKAQSLLDFNDLILCTLKLLKRQDGGLWVQYKLDLGIDHILVDEAQDTSPEQWQIIQILVQEFFAGHGQRDINRTIFAVGDEKQSIYSFQGAVPEDFAENGKKIAKAAEKVQQVFKKIRLDYSFRSTKDILQAVDLVFQDPKNYKGLSAENIQTIHEAIRSNARGDVELWDIFTPQIVDEPEDWREPVDQLQAPALRLAKEIAKKIDEWINNGEILQGKNRKIQASDIIVLVHQRDQFIPALARELKLRNIPVAGADRLSLTTHIAILDLLALGRFVLQSHDDLSLASILKSPLFNLTEEDLFLLAYQRQGSLWANLQKKAKDDARFHDIVITLKKYQAIIDTIPVFEFYSMVLGHDHGRKKILSRLGIEASDVLDAFMDYSLTIQQNGLPGLQVFLETIQKIQPEIKRELDQNRDEIRIMTVHAAKGLEAPIVFLVDAGKALWHSHHIPKLLPIKTPKYEGYLWQPIKELYCKIGENHIEILKEKKIEEYRRLLYVAMTRAEDRLIICGYRGQRKVEDTWADIISKALLPHAKEIDGPSEDIAAWRFAINHDTLNEDLQKLPANNPPNLPPLPDCLTNKMPNEKTLFQPLSVSKASDPNFYHSNEKDKADLKESWISPFTLPTKNTLLKADDNAQQHGIIIHKLLQYLPQLPKEHRKTYGLNYLKSQSSSFNKEDIIQHLLALMEDEQLKDLFSPLAQSEISITAKLNLCKKNYILSGKIDRIFIHDTITFCDFKTGFTPQDTMHIPTHHMNQIALYHHILKILYPNRLIKAWLIYSQSLKKYQIKDEELKNIMLKRYKVSN